MRRGPEIGLQDMPQPPPAENLPPGRPSFSDVRALREELSALELGRRQAFGSGGYLAPALIGVVAAGLAVAVGLAVAGYGTTAVIVLAAFALGIALLSMFGSGRALAPVAPVGDGRLRLPHDPPPEPRQSRGAAASPPWPEASQADEPEPVAVFDPAQAQRELAQLARERARRLVELGDAVESGDDAAATSARSRLRELDALIAAKEAEIESAEGGDGNGDAAVAPVDEWPRTPVANNSRPDDF